jgi:hypothetical protein
MDLLALGKEPVDTAARFLGAAKGVGGVAIAALCVASVTAPTPNPLTKFLRENFIYTLSEALRMSLASHSIASALARCEIHVGNDSREHSLTKRPIFTSDRGC